MPLVSVCGTSCRQQSEWVEKAGSSTAVAPLWYAWRRRSVNRHLVCSASKKVEHNYIKVIDTSRYVHACIIALYVIYS